MPRDDRKPIEVDPTLSKGDARIRFLADRVACLMAELVMRDLEYGDFCFDDWFELNRVRDNQYYPVCLDMVRRQLGRHDTRHARAVEEHNLTPGAGE